MPTILTNGIQLPDKGSVDWYGSMQSNYNLIDTHLGDTDVHVTAEDKANWNSKQGSLSQAQLDAIAQVATNTDDIASLQSGKANASHTHSSNDITDIGDYATKQYVDNSISGLVDNAPAALDTLKELSTALNDDANFASTVATALSAKANSADLATVATSGSYTDLTDKPTIPTVNDATLTIQKNGTTVKTFTANASSNVTANITVPTKTSDLTNDSNFVDTSNSAVASGITSAKVTDYDSHIADTDIHVTTADKNKWNNQTYVFRYSSTALVASSTNSNTLLDNTDNLKVGDKVIDSSGVLFSITAIDTQNSTFTIGTALIDLAQDSDVVHKSGDETVAGVKRFTNDIIRGSINTNSTIQARGLIGKTTVSTTGSDSSSYQSITATLNYSDNTPSKSVSVSLYVTETAYSDGRYSAFRPSSNNVTNLGTSEKRWANVYATNYYYGSNNVEFSTKFVTTDTNQTISGNKTFNSDLIIANTDTTANTPYILLKNSKYSRGSTTELEPQYIRFVDKANKNCGQLSCYGNSSGNTLVSLFASNTDSNNQTINSYVTLAKSSSGDASFYPNTDNTIKLGATNKRWSDVQTYNVNGVEPSSLGMPDIDNRIDISSYITDLSSAGNTYTPTVNGWICIRSANATKISVLDIVTNIGNGTTSNTATYLTVMTPVVANRKVIIRAVCTTLSSAYFIPCQGNV